MPHLSIIIPAWNEAQLIADAVRSAASIADEVIVVDGHSTDATVQYARAEGAVVLVSEKGRGIQMHAGALAATGDILLFLRADARLPANTRSALLERMNDPSIIGGNFLIEFLPVSWFTRLLVPFNDLRRRVTRRYYGDAGIFVRNDVYRWLGGFLPWPLMEDYEFSSRMEKAGCCIYIRDIRVAASARRFTGKEVRTLLLWMTLQLGYWLKVPAWILYKAYPDSRARDPQLFIEAYQAHFYEHYALPVHKARKLAE